MASIKYDEMNYWRFSAPIVIMNSVMTKVESNGETRSASDMINRTNSCSRTISINMRRMRNVLRFSLKFFVYENSIFTMRNMAVKMHTMKK